MTGLRFDLRDPPPGAAALRAEVRAFIAGHAHRWTPEVRARSWMGFDRDFTRAVGSRGWIGMCWPKAYGGAERSFLERNIVLEEMLAAGAPVGAHWIGDRQSGPLILRLGTEAQRQKYLPRIASGEWAFCIGLSEPDSGSDLASLRTRADRVPEGWRLNGRKIWTTFGHLCDWMIALVRTSPAPEGGARHQGLSQVLVDLKAPGVTIRPIRDLVGEQGFNEITFDDVLLPPDALVGEEGAGWAQATSELAFERSGPDRYLSSHPLLEAAVAELRGDASATPALGRQAARLWTLRAMSTAVAGMLQDGEDPVRQAALVKDLGNTFEQELPDAVRALVDTDAMPEEMRRMHAYLTQVVPTFSLRGGTREIMRGIIARELGLR
ncbi:acyl-CoA dehydrogenase family protein [Roseomonas sp. PWR1]|uniref:Acyl-CoA dehydrogenase family protein n=1 Tax=Roseomonas nitratireducens TaxID=2820810 RepID=A0ABS4AZZ8_9PROT|nr:acyl-CoA dehydrogenase family protein [Neoroseomonas nitratireducens]MBP0466393.1 acyl-CoA dehydrogenase family protein [Neoroseomonas nitratireducens]